MFRKWLSLCSLGVFLLGLSFTGLAEEHVIRMIGGDSDDNLTFDPYYLQVNVGDEVLFKAVDTGHYVASAVIPDGGERWRGDVDKDLRVKIDRPGYYLYTCPTHRALAMIGLIHAGEDHGNAEEVKKALEKMRPRIGMNVERIDELEKKLLAPDS